MLYETRVTKLGSRHSNNVLWFEAPCWSILLSLRHLEEIKGFDAQATLLFVYNGNMIQPQEGKQAIEEIALTVL
jgi:hypothetical protein